MPLTSQLFGGDPKLEACLVSDPAHIQQGAFGPHVAKIQTALAVVDGAVINAPELMATMYGSSTAAAVLAFKTKRNIINFGYQSTADSIVGKMTIAALDREVAAAEAQPQSTQFCELDIATPLDAGGTFNIASPNDTGSFDISASSSSLVGAPPPAADADVMAAALRTSRASLRDAQGDLVSVSAALRAGTPLVDAQTKTFQSATKWLNLNVADIPACIANLDSAANLFARNLAVRTSTGGDIVLVHTAGGAFHGLTFLNSPDRGLQCGDQFFTKDGPNCRRDVVTHEFFHLIGVQHGGGGLMGPTIRAAITTPAQALNSADNLAQLVAELRTFKSPNTDACARPGD